MGLVLLGQSSRRKPGRLWERGCQAAEGVGWRRARPSPGDMPLLTKERVACRDPGTAFGRLRKGLPCFFHATLSTRRVSEGSLKPSLTRRVV